MRRTFLDPGALNWRAELQRPVEMDDGCGGVTLTFETVDDIWVRLKPIRSATELEAQQVEETASHDITMRYRNDVASAWRLVIQDREFVLETIIDPDERKAYLVCQATEQGR